MSDTQKHIDLASKLPSLDAAYELWLWSNSPARKKDDEHDWKFPPSKFDASGSEFQKEAIVAAFARVKFNQDNAHLGPVFYWLKRAHSEIDDDSRRDAIRAAVKFYADCSKFFEYTSNFSEDLRVAVDLAAKANPGFTEPTIRKAHHNLGIAMR